MQKYVVLACLAMIAVLLVSCNKPAEPVVKATIAPTAAPVPSVSAVPISPTPTASSSEWTKKRLEAVIADNSPVYFVKDSTQLLPGEEAKLERILDTANHYKNIMFNFRGHTADAYAYILQLALSKARAEKIRWWFENRIGDDVTSVEAFGFASKYLVSKGNSEKAMAPNRRVEIVVEKADAK